MPKIDDPEFEHLCIELGLQDAIIPARTTGRYPADMFEGHDRMEIVALVKDEARVFSFVAREEDGKPIDELDIPEDSRVMFFYRDEKFMLPEPDSRLKRGDEAMIITHSRNIEKTARALARLSASFGRKSPLPCPGSHPRGKGAHSDSSGLR